MLRLVRSALSLLTIILAMMLFGGGVTAADLGREKQRPIAIISSLDEPFDLGPYIEYIEDPDYSMTWEALDAGLYDDQWQQNQEPVFVGRNVKSRYWFRVTVQLQTPEALIDSPVLYVAAQPGTINHLIVRLPDADGRER